MYYNMMTLKSFGGECEIELNKKGNKYQIYFVWREGEEVMEECYSKHVDYSTLDEAMRRFHIGVELIGRSFGDCTYMVEKIFG